MKQATDAEVLETMEARLILYRKSMSMAVALLSGKMVDAEPNRKEVLLALRQALEMTPDKAAQKLLSMELACLTAQDHLEKCSCCRRGGCHSNCRCSNPGNLKKYLDQAAL